MEKLVLRVQFPSLGHMLVAVGAPVLCSAASPCLCRLRWVQGGDQAWSVTPGAGQAVARQLLQMPDLQCRPDRGVHQQVGLSLSSPQPPGHCILPGLPSPALTSISSSTTLTSIISTGYQLLATLVRPQTASGPPWGYLGLNFFLPSACACPLPPLWSWVPHAPPEAASYHLLLPLVPQHWPSQCICFLHTN